MCGDEMNYTTLLSVFDEKHISYSTDEVLSSHSTFKVGGNADVFVIPASAEELKTVIKALCVNSVKFFIIGKGSNVLFDDAGYRGAIISTEKLNTIRVGKETVFAQCGVSFTSLALSAEKNGLSGLEFAYGIPGSVGGAVFMNAGAYGGEVSDILQSSEILDYSDPTDIRILELKAEDHKLGYRNSVLRHCPKWVHLSSCFRLKHGDPRKIRNTMDDFMTRRKEKQPLEYPSAGSTFKRPEGYFAGALIESSGLKGCSIGGAQVSEKHAGFIINKGNATCGDILELIDHVRKTVAEKHGVTLECEVIYVAP